MNRQRIIQKVLAAIGLSVGLLLAVSCGNKAGLALDDDTVVLTFANPSISASFDSKASIDGNNFPFSQTPYEVGLWLMQKDDLTTPQIDGFNNLKAEYLFADGVNQWTYYPFGTEASQTGESSLHIQKGKDLDIYAYHPWVEGVDDITSIPFVSGENDWMTSVPIRLAAAETMMPVTRSLEFRHLMTCIEVRIQCKYDGNITLTSMTLTDSKGRLVTSGTFDCTTVNISEAVCGTTGSQIIVEPKRSIGRSWISTYIIMPPISALDLAAKEMKLSFVFNDIEAETEFYLPSTMNGSNTPITEFKRGYKYIYELKLDNTMDFRPVGIEQQWTTQVITLPI